MTFNNGFNKSNFSQVYIYVCKFDGGIAIAVLKCSCGKSMTAGWSKGCKNYYLYYRCLEHTNINIPGNLLHENFEKVLRGLSFEKHHVNYLLETYNTMLTEPLKMKQEKGKEKISELREINRKIFKLEERFMNDEIESSTYQTWFKKLKEDKAILEYSINSSSMPKINKNIDIIQRLLPRLSNLYEIYEKGNITQKHTLIKGVFKHNLHWADGAFRTNYIDPTFHDNLLKIKEKGLLFNEQPFRKSDINPISTPYEEYFEHLNRFLMLLEPIIEDLERKKFI